MKKKSLLCCIMIIVMAVVALQTYIVNAKDYSGHWAEKNIDKLKESNILSGDEKGNINPDSFLKRCEFVKIINRAFSYQEKSEELYPDIKGNEWYAEEFKVAKKIGYIKGDEKGNVNPESNITRAEVAVILDRLINREYISNNQMFIDDTQIPDWSKQSIYKLVSLNLINGYEDKSFKANNNVTRAECCKIIDVMIQNKLNELEIIKLDVSIKEGTYKTSQSIKISSNIKDVDIYYTLDGTNPTVNSNKYNKELIIDKSLELRIIGIKDGYKDSEIQKHEYIINKVVSSVGGGSYINYNLENDYNELEIIYAINDCKYCVTQNLILPVLGSYGSQITWQSNNEACITNSGVVVRPNDNSVIVNLEATLSNNGQVKTKQFEVKVSKVFSRPSTSLVESTTNNELYELNDMESIDIVVGADNAIECIDGRFTDYKIENMEEAIYSLNSIKTLMGITNPENEFRASTIEENNDEVIYRIQQTFNGIDVFGKQLIITTDKEGNSTSLMGDYDINISIPVTPTVTEASAVEIAKNGESLLNNNNEDNRLVIYSLTGTPKLAWEIVVYGIISDVQINKSVFIDAQTGDKLDELSNVYNATETISKIDLNGNMNNINVESDLSIYYLVDKKRNIEVGNGDDYYSIRFFKNQVDQWNNPAAVSLYINLQKTYDYYKNVLGRKSYDGKGAKILGVANAIQLGDSVGDNANWYSSSNLAEWAITQVLELTGDIKNHTIFVGEGNQYFTNVSNGLDVIAHEFTHGVTSKTAKLLNKGISGAINESYSDILGNFVEGGDWLIGEDIVKDTFSGRALRNMANPNEFQNPSEVGGEYYINPNSINDQGGVHNNSSILSRAAYLMYDKGITNKNVLAKLWYSSLLNLTPTSDFYDCRRAVISCANKMNMTDNEIKIIKQSFDEVNIKDGTASTNLSGKIYFRDLDTDISNNGTISNVEVSIKEKKKGSDSQIVTSNEQGEYLFENIKRGTYILTVKRDQYVDYEYIIVVDDNTVHNVYLVVDENIGISGKVTIADNDTNMTNNNPLINADVYLYVFDENKNNYVLIKNNVQTDNKGKYSIRNLKPGVYGIVVTKDEYLTVRQNNIIIRKGAQNVFNFTIESISELNNGNGTASGYIRDMKTGEGVSSLTIKIREGLNNYSGEIEGQVLTHQNGSYATGTLPAGNYTLQIVDEREDIDEEDRYLDNYFNIKVLGNQDIENQNGVVTQVINEEQLRIVLRWGEQPRDLDSYLYGPSISSTYKRLVYYDDKNERENNIDYVNLDVDDTSSYGPETVTIYVPIDGNYTYMVHNYSDRSITSESTSDKSRLANSGATIQVFSGAAIIPIYEFEVPDSEGNTWEVFEYNSITKNITPINRMYYSKASDLKSN